jgi:hypothetical protein
MVMLENSFKMVINLKVNIRMVSQMDKASINGLMEVGIKESFRMD